jgi:uncharacterized membrane protein
MPNKNLIRVYNSYKSFKQDGQRDAAQVLSNGFMATFFSVLYLLDCGFGEKPIDFIYDYKATRYSLAVLGKE